MVFNLMIWGQWFIEKIQYVITFKSSQVYNLDRLRFFVRPYKVLFVFFC